MELPSKDMRIEPWSNPISKSKKISYLESQSRQEPRQRSSLIISSRIELREFSSWMVLMHPYLIIVSFRTLRQIWQSEEDALQRLILLTILFMSLLDQGFIYPKHFWLRFTIIRSILTTKGFWWFSRKLISPSILYSWTRLMG